MKKLSLHELVWMMVLALFATTVSAQNTITTPRAASPAAEVSQTIGISKVTINYSRPAVSNREGRIWGQIVPYGYTVHGFGNGKEIPWRAGANENTIITFSDDVKVEGQDLEAGSYGLHIAYFQNGEADIIFSSNTESWGSFWYEESETVLKVKVKVEDHAFTERLTYAFTNIDANSAIAVLDWENKRFPFKVAYEVNDLVIANAKNELRNTQGFGFQGPMSAAQFCLANNTHLEEALTWADLAVNITKNAQTLTVKGNVLLALKRQDEAMTVMQEMVDHPTASPNNYYSYGNQLITLDQDEKALEVFKSMYKRWPNNAFAQHGMARAYSANGDFKKALKYEKECINNPTLPPNNKPILEGFVKRLEKGEDITAPPPSN